MNALRTLYPPIAAFQTGSLPVSATHTLYFEQAGNPAGKPVVFLHGGPGAGLVPQHRQFFDPTVYRIILFDQRGVGQSTPHACLEENTTWDLVADIERLRTHLGIDRWQVFGGSWGSTLAMAYAETHPERVTEMVLRGIWFVTQSELDWMYAPTGGAAHVYPERYHPFLAFIPEAERDNIIAAYHRRLTADNEATQLAAARLWSGWEGAIAMLTPDQKTIDHFEGAQVALAMARLETHYFMHGCFFRSPTQLLDEIARLHGIPATLVHGRHDMCCPFSTAVRLHTAWPSSTLVAVEGAGHSAFEPGITSALVAATDRYGGIHQ